MLCSDFQTDSDQYLGVTSHIQTFAKIFWYAPQGASPNTCITGNWTYAWMFLGALL